MTLYELHSIIVRAQASGFKGVEDAARQLLAEEISRLKKAGFTPSEITWEVLNG